MFAIIGLGNPGDKYIDIRHNTGFMVIDKLADDLNIKVEKLKKGISRYMNRRRKVILAKPKLYEFKW